MLNNILKVQQNWSWAKKLVSFFIQGTLFKNYCVNDQHCTGIVISDMEL